MLEHEKIREDANIESPSISIHPSAINSKETTE